MSAASQAEVHRAINARMAASERARKEPPPSPYGVEPEFRCANCGAAPVGGYRGGIEDVIRQSTHAGVAVWGTIDAALRVCCGENCERQYNLEHKRGNVADAFKRLQLAALVPTPSQPAPGTTRSTAIRCARAECKEVLRVTQSVDSEGTWSPDVAKLQATAGWQGNYCSKTCVAIMASDANMRALYEPEVKPVMAINDASYQARRPPSAAELRQRDIAREMPATGKKGGR